MISARSASYLRVGRSFNGRENTLEPSEITVTLRETLKTIQTNNEGEVPIELRSIYPAIDGAASHKLWTDGKASNVTRMPGF